jgi:hypothetical protein
MVRVRVVLRVCGVCACVQELYLLVRDAGIRTYVVGQFISDMLQNRILPFPEKTQSDYVSVKEVLTRRREDEGDLPPGTSESKFAKKKRARKLKRDKMLKVNQDDDSIELEEDAPAKKSSKKNSKKGKNKVDDDEDDQAEAKEVSHTRPLASCACRVCGVWGVCGVV